MTENPHELALNVLRHANAALIDAPEPDLIERFEAACQCSPSLFNASLVERIQKWVDGSSPPLGGHDEVFWFLSKRAHLRINEWLMNKKLAALPELSPTRTGIVVIPRSGVEHVRNSRTMKDGVTQAGVVELLGQLFVYGSPKFAPNPGYPNQLLMFDESYRAIDPAARAESPVAALSFGTTPRPHLRLETAYWMKPAKTQALLKGALSKKK